MKKLFMCNCVASCHNVIKKKVNQRKYKIHCTSCKVTKTIIIPENFELCMDCKGAGNKIVHGIGGRCSHCDGSGMIGWTDKVLRGI